MYQFIMPIGFIGVVLYVKQQYEKYVFDNNCLHNGTFDDFYIVDVEKDL